MIATALSGIFSQEAETLPSIVFKVKKVRGAALSGIFQKRQTP
jgi:hypothetical protein